MFDQSSTLPVLARWYLHHLHGPPLDGSSALHTFAPKTHFAGSNAVCCYIENNLCGNL